MQAGLNIENIEDFVDYVLCNVPVEGDEGHGWDAYPAAEGESHGVSVHAAARGRHQGQPGQRVTLQVQPQPVVPTQVLQRGQVRCCFQEKVKVNTVAVQRQLSK